jgi:flagellar hook-associated protein 1 FlgK
MSLVGALLSAVSGLQTAQAQLQITSNNIANVNTAGYSRKTATPETTVIDGAVAGVRLADVQRTVDEGLLRQLREHIARLSGQSVQSNYLERTQILFGSPGDNTSLSHSLSALGAALESLSVDPDSLANKMSVVDLARHLSEQLNLASQGIQNIRLDAQRQIPRSVTAINDALSEIHDLNQEIAGATALGDSVPDLEDRRDVLLTGLAEEIDIQYYTRSTGQVVISTGAGRLLLDTAPVTLSHSAASALSADTTYGNGLSGILYGPTSVDITSEIQGGRLGGLLTVRDQTMVDLQAEIDRLAEVLRDQINALHNDGTAFPPPATLTGTRSIATTDAPQMSGTFRVSVVDVAGVVVETLDIDLAALAPADIGTLVAQISGMANASASINASGQVVISATGGNRIAINEMDSAVTSGNATYGMAQFLGLNDLFTSGLEFNQYTSDRAASDSAALGVAGTLSFNVAGATTGVAYAAGDDLNDIATAINAAMGGANISATVVREGTGYRLKILDADGDNFFLSDSGGLTGQLNLRAGAAGTAERLGVRSEILQDPNLLSHAELSAAGGLAAGDIAVSAGDGALARALAGAFGAKHDFTAAGGLSQVTTTLSDYATQILSVNAAMTESLADTVATGERTRIALDTQVAEVSQVNLDEELANIIVLQNAYAASARVTAAVSEMIDTLLEIV